jgi:hypothetical protein
MNDDTAYKEYMDADSKVYVDVNADCLKDGTIMPRSFVWEDDTRYEIDKVTDIRPAASLKAGGAGLRYTVFVGKRQTYMFFEEEKGVSKWFMERR